ncbi:MAG: YabD protein [Anaerolinea thermophila]|uniref:YabD protein n=1 Tax=Anaerolinea thermophila TaxID=167964 RepID=A0A101FYL9_9CHLR|nr:MAG: YabD protein [Anaerolinea thermophila]
MKGLFDSHCHLYAPQFKGDLDAVIQRALEQNVTHILVPAEDYESSIRTLQICSEYTEIEIYAALGIQPQNANSTVNENIYNHISFLTPNPKVVAIGEIGLDYYWTQDEKDVQKAILNKGLDLAIEVDKPVVLHNRESTSDMLSILQDWLQRIPLDKTVSTNPGVFHGYNGDPQILDFAIKNSFYLGIGGPVTFKNAKVLQASITRIPLDRILIETDSPYLSPHPLRGRRNEPSFVAYIAQRLADLYGKTIEEIIEVTTENAKRLFKIGVK